MTHGYKTPRKAIANTATEESHLPINGTCCSCGYSGGEETECPAREDKVHCNHWWDGPEEMEDSHD
jgi:hypothetical protein